MKYKHCQATYEEIGRLATLSKQRVQYLLCEKKVPLEEVFVDRPTGRPPLPESIMVDGQTYLSVKEFSRQTKFTVPKIQGMVRHGKLECYVYNKNIFINQKKIGVVMNK